MTYYVTTLLVYAAVDILACLAISLQFGVSGIVNFSFIIFQAAGAYTAAVLSLPRDTANGGFQTYILGLNLSFPIPWIAATLVGALLAPPIGLVVLRRLRGDYQAIAMLVLSVIASLVVTNTPASSAAPPASHSFPGHFLTSSTHTPTAMSGRTPPARSCWR